MSHHRSHHQAVARQVAGEVSFHVAQQLGKGTLRVGDAERDNAAQALGEHYAVGRLDRAEYDERLEAVFSARTQGELRAVFRDLPERRPVVAPRPGPLPVRPRHGFPVPFWPVLLVLVGIAFATGAAWVVWVGLGTMLCAKKVDRDRRRRRRQRQVGWA